MARKKKILVVFGTRPEAIKLSPVIKALNSSFNVRVCVTAQHREMLDQVLKIFSINVNYDLNVMKANQNLFDVTKKILSSFRKILDLEKPDLVVVHGDTTTTMTASLASFYMQIPVAHVEAGLRTYNLRSPFPEELNRQLTSRIADFHFAPTEEAKLNLLQEGINNKRIFVTGNTVIDAMLESLKKARRSKFPSDLLTELPFLKNIKKGSKKIVLVTGHRRENFGESLKQICLALKDLANKYNEIEIIYPVHLNPLVLKPVTKELSGVRNIHLIKPIDYLPFLKLMDICYFILSDSGGIQEEAPSLGKPVLLMRDTTERPEAVKAGTVKIVGSDRKKIISTCSSLIDNQKLYNLMAKAHNPYGEGKSSKMISDILIRNL